MSKEPVESSISSPKKSGDMTANTIPQSVSAELTSVHFVTAELRVKYESARKFKLSILCIIAAVGTSVDARPVRYRNGPTTLYRMDPTNIHNHFSRDIL